MLSLNNLMVVFGLITTDQAINRFNWFISYTPIQLFQLLKRRQLKKF